MSTNEILQSLATEISDSEMTNVSMTLVETKEQYDTVANAQRVKLVMTTHNDVEADLF